jgi:hypothetical protein
MWFFLEKRKMRRRQKAAAQQKKGAPALGSPRGRKLKARDPKRKSS